MKIITEMFTVQSSMDANYLSIKFPEEPKLDEISIKVIHGDCPDFLIPFRLTAINDNVVLKYKLVNATALKYTNMTLPKNIFVKMYLNLLIPFVKGKDWFLDAHNICIDPQYVYCDNYTYKMHFIYVPEKTYRNTDDEIMQFFKNVFVNTTISDDKDFQVNLFRYFSNGETTLTGLYQMFKEEEARLAAREQLQPVQSKTDVNAVNHMSVKVTSVNVEKSYADALKTEKKTDEKKEAERLPGEENNRNVIEDLFSGKKKEKSKKTEKTDKTKTQPEKKKGRGGLFGKKKESTLQESIASVSHGEKEEIHAAYVQSQQPLYSQLEISDETEIFGGAVGCIPASLELLDSAVPGAMSRIMLDFSSAYVTIGRISSDEVKPDIAFPAEFKRIGRRHARIERRDGKYYIVDLGSMNHTLLDGRKLLPNQPYQLENGMEITFTDSKPVRYRVSL